MDNLPDKDIDYIFREGSEKHNFPFKESSWDNMDALLDKEVKKRHWKRWTLLALLLITFAGIGVSGYWTKVSKKISTPNTIIENVAVINEKESKDLVADNTIISNDDTSTNDDTTSSAMAIPNTNSITDNKTLPEEQRIDNNVKVKKSLLKDDNQIYIKINKYNSPFTNKASSTLNQKEQPNANNEEITNKLNNPITYGTTQSIASTDRTDFNVVPISSRFLNTLTLDPAYDGNNLKGLPNFDRTKPKKDNFKLGFVTGIEQSSVGMMNDSKKGYKLGLELVYQFGNRFQVSSGFIVSKKKYETKGTNYNARVERWVDEVTPQTVQGSCDIFEIPLDFTYYFKGYETSSFFINGGLNSYIMRKEWYDFEYESGTNMQDLPAYWTGKMKNNHFLSVSNFSIGYQRILSDKMTIQLAPYVQIPLTGIGDGQVKLYTTGLQMKMLFGK